jgi:transcriptional regulator with XRE-family HTH domain
VDDLGFGRLIRLTRIRRRLTQEDLASRAGVSRPVVSRLEHGHLGQLRFDTVRAIAAALEIRVEALPRTRAVDVDRVMNGRHAALAEHIVGWIARHEGWAIRPETSFSEYGERGVIDLLCWHAATRSLLVIEIKTELLDFGELLGKLDIKERLGPRVAGRLGWRPTSISTALLVAESTTNRRRATAHAGLLRTALSADGRAFAAWLVRPTGAIHALRFVSDVRTGNVRSGFGSPTRVRSAGSGRQAVTSRRPELAKRSLTQ